MLGNHCFSVIREITKNQGKEKLTKNKNLFFQNFEFFLKKQK
jgi:hypothetical protein